MKISIVIPVYNEESCIEKTLIKTREFLISKDIEYEIIVADDGSTDKTRQIVEKFVNDVKDNNIKFVTENKHLGKGYAVNLGMKNASAEYILFMDADLSTDIVELEKFLLYMRQGIDVIIGSRRIPGSKIVVHQPFYREFMGQVFTWIANLILGTNFSDFTCGFKCFSSYAKNEIFRRQKITNWSFDAEILFLAKKLGFKIKEVPVIWKNDPSTKVNLFRDTLSSFRGLIKIRKIHRNIKNF
ncbi:MAG: dolichyl-phosphate beta-glucosyltransferase [Endomicrobiia bacterium]